MDRGYGVLASGSKGREWDYWDLATMATVARKSGTGPIGITSSESNMRKVYRDQGIESVSAIVEPGRLPRRCHRRTSLSANLQRFGCSIICKKKRYGG